MGLYKYQTFEIIVIISFGGYANGTNNRQSNVDFCISINHNHH
ncbi:nucleotidyltransferase domain-containing protein [Metabacillus dongyingensis]